MGLDELMCLSILVVPEESPGEDGLGMSIAFDVVGAHLREEVNEGLEFARLGEKEEESVEVFEGWAEATF